MLWSVQQVQHSGVSSVHALGGGGVPRWLLGDTARGGLFPFSRRGPFYHKLETSPTPYIPRHPIFKMLIQESFKDVPTKAGGDGTMRTCNSSFYPIGPQLKL